MKLITLTQDYRFQHLWIQNVHGPSIPDTAIQVTDAVYMDLSQNPNSKKYNPDTETVSDYIAPFDFSESFATKESEIRSKFTEKMKVITSSYTDEDIASFPTQEAEAKAWQADNTAQTPFIDGLLANRPSVDKPALVQRIIDNSAAYKAVAGPAIGKKQHFEDLLYALKAQHEDLEQPDATKAEIDAIVVDFS